MRTIKCCSVVFGIRLRLLVLHRRLLPSTNSTAYNRRHVTTCHGSSQLSVLQLAVEPFTACNAAKYWPGITFFLPHLQSTQPLGGPRRNIAITFGIKKLEWCGYPMVKIF